jgi:hypothetical protein
MRKTFYLNGCETDSRALVVRINVAEADVQTFGAKSASVSVLDMV